MSKKHSIREQDRCIECGSGCLDVAQATIENGKLILRIHCQHCGYEENVFERAYTERRDS